MVKCPFPGCSNRERILLEDLVKDLDLSHKIAAKIREERDG
jgi:hypothetical protein